MAFNTPEFFVFWFITTFVFLLAGKANKLKVGLLLLSNLAFFTLLTKYAVIVLLMASALDFFIAKGIHQSNSENRKLWLMRLSALFNVLLILGFRHISDWLHLNDMTSSYHFPVPLVFIGVSFYAFRSMSYVFDVYYENIETAETNIWHYWTYASFYPVMLSGPITAADTFLAKLRDKQWLISSKDIAGASFYLSSGIIKKFILGNYLAYNFIDRVFESASFFTSLEVFLAAIMQTFALYLDFSGYTDMAIGLSLFLGFRISQNFNFPFFAKNVSDYWKRWHISLSQWFNNYVYFPLSYRLRTWKRFGTSVAVFIVFVVSGFWHGTAPNFWLWGVMHAICMVWDIYTANIRNTVKSHLPWWIYNPISIFLTFGFLTYSGIYFKAIRIEEGNLMMAKIFDGVDWSLFPEWYNLYSGVFWVFIVAVFGHFTLASFYTKLYNWFEQRSVIWSALLLFVAIFIAYQFDRLGSLPFYYLQF